MTARIGHLQPLAVRRTRIRCLRPKFYVGGKLAVPGEVYEMDSGDCEHLLERQHAELLGDAPDRLIPVSALGDPPPAGGRWPMR